MIIRIMATALVQCMARTHAGWITFVGACVAWLSVAATLDMAVSWLKPVNEYTPEVAVSLLHQHRRVEDPQPLIFTKKRAGFPGSPSRIPVGDLCCGDRDPRYLRGRHQHGVDHMDHT